MTADPIIYLEHADDILAHCALRLGQGRQVALVSSVDIMGGTARELGSLAVVEPGRMTGYLSNGCVDRDILLNAEAALEAGEARLVHYGAGSPLADLALPCGGMLKVLIDPSPDAARVAEAAKALAARQDASLTFAHPDMPLPLTVRYEPKPRLVLAGRGAVLRSMAEVGNAAGFEMNLMSPDQADLDELSCHCSAAPVHLVSPDAPPELSLDARSAFLTLFHDHDWEPHLLLAAVRSGAHFVGAMGSRRTHMARVAHMASLGATDAELARIEGPIGLVGSLRSAHLIAVSAVAQIAGVFPRNQTAVVGTAMAAQ